VPRSNSRNRKWELGNAGKLPSDYESVETGKDKKTNLLRCKKRGGRGVKEKIATMAEGSSKVSTILGGGTGGNTGLTWSANIAKEMGENGNIAL